MNLADQVGYSILDDVRSRVLPISCKVEDNSYSRSIMDRLIVSCEFMLPVIEFCSWLAPEPDFVMINSVGSKKFLTGGLGAVSRTSSGGVIAAAMGGFPQFLLMLMNYRM